VDWECGGRDKATGERLIERLKRWQTRLYCTDDYAVYHYFGTFISEPRVKRARQNGHRRRMACAR
jgi:IS1 family transposase